MTPTKYHELAMRTAKRISPPMDLIHAAMGLAGEVGELAECELKWPLARTKPDKEKARENLVEELGDACWFIALGADTLTISFESIWIGAELHADEPFPNALTRSGAAKALCATSGMFVDAVKRHTVYNKPWDQREACRGLVFSLRYILRICARSRIEIEEVLAHNIEKLRERYPEKYTDYHAVARLDKA